MILPIKSHHSAWVLRQVFRFLWVQCHRFSSYFAVQKLACEQALRSAVAAGREKEGELATTSLKFEYLHRKSRCEMLIGGDDGISNDVITLGTCFSMFVYIRARFPFALIDGNLTVQSTGSHRGYWRWSLHSRDVVASSSDIQW